MDFLTPNERSAVMSRIRSTDTKAEVRLRKALFARGFRYRKNVRTLPGTPDIVLPKYRYAVQVRGCFWHAHAGCRRAHRPATNVDYWLPKLKRNSARDRVADKALRALDWRLRIVWECEIGSQSLLDEVAELICSEIASWRRSQTQRVKR